MGGCEEDIAELLAMIGRGVRDSILVPRSYDDIRRKATDFLIMTLDGNVVGSVALHAYANRVGELACLFVKQSHGGNGYGQTLVKAAEEKAQQQGLMKIFALTTGASKFFTQQAGYQALNLDTIPRERYELLQASERRSLAFGKDIS